MKTYKYVLIDNGNAGVRSIVQAFDSEKEAAEWAREIITCGEIVSVSTINEAQFNQHKNHDDTHSS